MDLVKMILLKCGLPAVVISLIIGLLWQWSIARLLLLTLVMAVAIFLVHMIDGLIRLWYARYKGRQQEKDNQA